MPVEFRAVLCPHYKMGAIGALNLGPEIRGMRNATATGSNYVACPGMFYQVHLTEGPCGPWFKSAKLAWCVLLRRQILQRGLGSWRRGGGCCRFRASAPRDFLRFGLVIIVHWPFPVTFCALCLGLRTMAHQTFSAFTANTSTS